MEIFYDIIEKGYIHYYNFVIIAALVLAFVFRKEIERHSLICVIFGALFVVFVWVLCEANWRIGAAVFDNAMFFIACLGFRFLFLPIAQLHGKMRDADQKGLHEKKRRDKKNRMSDHYVHRKPRQCRVRWFGRVV